ncbi:hypothetical protein HPB51_011675 [Rhipicephalus microplus]|uniref:Uncharacterized protein n=1 Tax=Rhipicephalus microplus TaxID=6941 RepID=A0A9J6DMU0_RHIMP|nr:hypothetical protein HPB51_011675 [Rhipicephalus microplus]
MRLARPGVGPSLAYRAFFLVRGCGFSGFRGLEIASDNSDPCCASTLVGSYRLEGGIRGNRPRRHIEPRVTQLGGSTFEMLSLGDALCQDPKCLTDDLDGLGMLTDLDLSCNELRKLERYAFHRVPNLKTLKLSGNPLKFVDSSWFKNMDVLEMLGIAGDRRL